MDKTRWFIFAGICAAVIAGLILTSSKDKINVDNVDAFAVTTDKTINDHVFGNKDAKVTLWEYADFQCPGCGAAYPHVKSIKQRYRDSVRYVFRNFPLTSAHPHAFAASAAAEAAGIQGKYWEMNDRIFSNRDEWQNTNAEQRQTVFERYAGELGLDLAKFKTDIASKEVAAKINYDRSIGIKAGVDSTPTFYLNTTKISSDITGDLLQGNTKKLTDALDNAIRQTGGTPPQATAQQ